VKVESHGRSERQFIAGGEGRTLFC
jgi:hypothetical protein